MVNNWRMNYSSSYLYNVQYYPHQTSICLLPCIGIPTIMITNVYTSTKIIKKSEVYSFAYMSPYAFLRLYTSLARSSRSPGVCTGITTDEYPESLLWFDVCLQHRWQSLIRVRVPRCIRGVVWLNIFLVVCVWVHWVGVLIEWVVLSGHIVATVVLHRHIITTTVLHHGHPSPTSFFKGVRTGIVPAPLIRHTKATCGLVRHSMATRGLVLTCLEQTHTNHSYAQGWPAATGTPCSPWTRTCRET